MENKDFYYDLKSKEKELELNYMISAILRSRLNLKLDEGSASEEDINIYLANTLLLFAQNEWRELVARYISLNDMDVFNMAESSSDNYLKHVIYKVNADNLLLSLGLFEDAIALERENCYIGRAKFYYDIAAEYNMKLYRHLTSIGDILHRLSDLLEKYVEILKVVRKDYFNFVTAISDDNLLNLSQDIKEFEKTRKAASAQDEFLDIYSQWLKEHRQAS